MMIMIIASLLQTDQKANAGSSSIEGQTEDLYDCPLDLSVKDESGALQDHNSPAAPLSSQDDSEVPWSAASLLGKSICIYTIFSFQLKLSHTFAFRIW